MQKPRNLPGIAVSVTLHTALLVALNFIPVILLGEEAIQTLETVFIDEPEAEQIQQELELDTRISTSNNLVAGGLATAQAIGSGSPSIQQAKIEQSESLKEPTIEVNVGDVSLPLEEFLGDDLGEIEIAGEVAAVVDGYGAAMSRITAELKRMMRQKPVMVVWLFDESESMRDDQEKIRQEFHKVYEELRIQKQRENTRRGGKEILLTSVMSFGDAVHTHTRRPTADINEIRASIDKIPIDRTGNENMCTAVSVAIDAHRRPAQRNGRKLVVIIVSDESGDDGVQGIEDTVAKARRAQAPVYILGREAVFGYPYAHTRWVDPKYMLTHHIRINRGPETAMAEALQWDGLHSRWDVVSSGFGPYAQSRLARETGGIFFVLPTKEATLTGLGADGDRQYAFLAMKEYQPLLMPRRDYVDARQNSDFRAAVWEIILYLNPFIDPELEIREHWYPVEAPGFREVGQREFQKALRAMGLLTKAIGILDKALPLRATEDSQRWRANYDLLRAQCLAYRVRLFQFLLAIDGFMAEFPKPTNPMTNGWNIARSPEMQLPTKRQIQLTKVDVDLLKQQQDLASDLFKKVIQDHPGTPWALRAGFELRMGFGMRFVEGWRDPNYDRVGSEIQVPNF